MRRSQIGVAAIVTSTRSGLREFKRSNAAPGECRQSERGAAVKRADKQAANKAAHLTREHKSQEAEAVAVAEDDGITGPDSDNVRDEAQP